jgi:hypothetical protein
VLLGDDAISTWATLSGEVVEEREGIPPWRKRYKTVRVAKVSYKSRGEDVERAIKPVLVTMRCDKPIRFELEGGDHSDAKAVGASV